MSDDLTPAAAIRAFSFGTPAPATPAQAPPAAPAPTTPTAPATPEPYEPCVMSPSDAARWIEVERDNLERGTISQQEFSRRLDALGATPAQRLPDTRPDEVRLLDQHSPVAKPDEFLLRYGAPGQVAPPMTPELKQFDTSARTWLAGAEFTRDGGSAFVDMIAKVAQRTQHLNADELESYGMVEYDKLQRAYGGEDTLQEKLQRAAVMIHELDKKQPGLKNLLRSKGIGDNALVVAQIIGQSERWHARRRKGR